MSGAPITPQAFQAEVERALDGGSRNTARFRKEGGGWQDWLELWPRHGRPDDRPYLVNPARTPTETDDPVWLAQFTFSYDPARYPAPPTAPRGLARLRAFLESFRRDDVPVVPSRRLVHPARHHWPEEDEESYEEIEDAAASCDPW